MFLIDSIKGKFKQILDGFDGNLEKAGTLALAIVLAYRAFLQEPAELVLLAILPSDLDEATTAKVLVGLDKAITVLSEVDGCKECTDLETKAGSFGAEIRRLDIKKHTQILFKVAGIITAEIDGHRFKQDVYDSAVLNIEPA